MTSLWTAQVGGYSSIGCGRAGSASRVLREWYSHDPEKFDEFARRYRAELNEAEHKEAVEHLRELAKHQTITLLTATQNPAISGATVLAELISH